MTPPSLGANTTVYKDLYDLFLNWRFFLLQMIWSWSMSRGRDCRWSVLTIFDGDGVDEGLGDGLDGELDVVVACRVEVAVDHSQSDSHLGSVCFG